MEEQLLYCMCMTAFLQVLGRKRTSLECVPLAGERDRERGECAFRVFCVMRILRFFFSGEGVSACRWWLKAH